MTAYLEVCPLLPQVQKEPFLPHGIKLTLVYAQQMQCNQEDQSAAEQRFLHQYMKTLQLNYLFLLGQTLLLF